MVQQALVAMTEVPTAAAAAAAVAVVGVRVVTAPATVPRVPSAPWGLQQQTVPPARVSMGVQVVWVVTWLARYLKCPLCMELRRLSHCTVALVGVSVVLVA